MVSQAEACTASPDDGFVCPFGDIDVATAEVLLSFLERINLRTVVHMNKPIGDSTVNACVERTACSVSS